MTSVRDLGTATLSSEKFKSRLTVWEVKMRLALGFCGQFAKATFSSLSAKKLEVGHQIEVGRGVFFCTVLGDAL